MLVDRNFGWGIGSGELKEKRVRGVVVVVREDVKKFVVVVELFSKVKMIIKYFGFRYVVLFSYGYVWDFVV